MTGESAGALQCGPGFYLTADGCLKIGPCEHEPGKAWNGGQCIPIVSGGANTGMVGGTNYYHQYPNAGYYRYNGYSQPNMGQPGFYYYRSY
jgi:hypothetical protein